MGQTLSEPVVEKVSRPEIFQFAMICLPLPTLPWDASRMGFSGPRSPPCAHICFYETLQTMTIGLTSSHALFQVILSAMIAMRGSVVLEGLSIFCF